jgi:glutaminyl-tRNA synthetase
MYDRLFSVEEPDKNKDVNSARFVNPESFSQVRGYIEPAVVSAAAGEKFQFQRLGYFILENKTDEHLVFNKTVGLRDKWKKS